MNDIYNAKQGLQAVVAKQRHMLPNDVIFRKKKEKKQKALMLVYLNSR